MNDAVIEIMAEEYDKELEVERMKEALSEVALIRDTLEAVAGNCHHCGGSGKVRDCNDALWDCWDCAHERETAFRLSAALKDKNKPVETYVHNL